MLTLRRETTLRSITKTLHYSDTQGAQGMVKDQMLRGERGNVIGLCVVFVGHDNRMKCSRAKVMSSLYNIHPQEAEQNNVN
jgi:hypothetical protein